MKIAVYGTLKKGQVRAFALSKQKFLGEAETEPLYSLHDNGHYPMLVEGGATSVKCELYEVDDECMKVLDGIEGVAYGLYKRAKIAIQGVTDEVIGYIFCKPVDHYPNCGREWPPVKS